MNTPIEPSAPRPESFWKKQGKLAFTTFNISSIATLTISFWTTGAFFLSLILLIILFAVAGSGDTGDKAGRIYTTTYGDVAATHKILSIPVRGPIEGSAADYGYAAIFADPTIAYGYDLKQELIDAADSGEYDGVVLELNSPGGTVNGASAISDGIDYFKQKTGKPVYASIQGMAASGAYWAAVSTDKIFADTGTGAGSIGVIFGPFTYFDKVTAIDGVTTENGIDQYYLTAGEGKDAGNPFRRLSDKEREIFQQGVNDTYDEFVTHVSKERGIPKEVIVGQIGAHYYAEKQALSLKLIDAIASPQQVYAAVAKEAGVQDDYQIVSSHADASGLASLFGVKIPWLQKKATPARDASRVQACTGSISAPLVYYGNPSATCK